MLTRAPSFFFPRVVRSSVSGIKWTQKRVGVTSPTVRLIPDTADAGNAALKIAIVSSPSGVDDGSFNEDNYNGILSFIEKNPSQI